MNPEQALESVLNRDKKAIEAALSQRLDPNLAVGGQPLLHWCCSVGANEIAALLLSRGAEANSTGIDGETPLMVSAYSGDASLVGALLKAGAMVNQADSDGRNALMFAAKSGNVETIRLLLSSGANIAMADAHGRTALHWSVIDGDNVRALESLIEAGGTNQVSAEGLSVADYCERLNRTECESLLRRLRSDKGQSEEHS